VGELSSHQSVQTHLNVPLENIMAAVKWCYQLTLPTGWRFLDEVICLGKCDSHHSLP